MRNRHKPLSICNVDIGPGRHGSLAVALGVEVNEDPKIVFVSPDDKTAAELETNNKAFRHNLNQVVLS